jgi:thiamine pyrophosphokinase
MTDVLQGLEVICGDLDSLFSRVRDDAQRRGTKVVEDPDQNSTDFTKGIAYLRGNVFSKLPSASNIVCLGGLGGRVDQALSQLHHLYMEQQDPHYKNGRIYLLSTEGITFVLKRGKHRIRVHDPRSPVLGKHIGIIPLKEPSIITTKGLKWDVTDWPTEFGGQISTSNLVREDVVEITTIGDVLFTIDLNFPPGNHEHPGLRRELSPIISMEDDMFFGIGTNSYPY